MWIRLGTRPAKEEASQPASYEPTRPAVDRRLALVALIAAALALASLAWTPAPAMQDLAVTSRR